MHIGIGEYRLCSGARPCACYIIVGDFAAIQCDGSIFCKTLYLCGSADGGLARIHIGNYNIGSIVLANDIGILGSYRPSNGIFAAISTCKGSSGGGRSLLAFLNLYASGRPLASIFYMVGTRQRANDIDFLVLNHALRIYFRTE